MKSKFYQNYLFFFRNTNNLLLTIIAIASFLSTYYLRDNLYTNIALGSHCLIFFIPFFLYSVYQIYFLSNNFNFFKFFIFTLLVFIPAYSFIFNNIKFIQGDDAHAYFEFAHYMIDNLTLTLTENSIPYHKQPGAAYFYALELLIFNNESRLLQLFNLLLYFSVFFYFINFLINNFNRINKIFIFIFIILSIPFAIKSVLGFYVSWIVVSLTFLSFISYFKRKYFIFIILIALLPFFRQNLIFVSFFIFISFMIKNLFIEKNKNFYLFFLYFFVFLLPIYHNFYYANSLNFFVIYIPDETMIYFGDTKNEIAWSSFINDLLSFRFPDYNILLPFKEQVIQRIKMLMLMDMSLTNKIMSIFVIPAFLYFFYMTFFQVNNYKDKFLTLTFFILIFFPTVVGSGYFPRFENMTIYCSYVFLFSMKFKNNLIK